MENDLSFRYETSLPRVKSIVLEMAVRVGIIPKPFQLIQSMYQRINLLVVCKDNRYPEIRAYRTTRDVGLHNMVFP